MPACGGEDEMDARTPNEDKDLLSIAQVARMLNATYKTVWTWVRNGRLPALDTAPPGARLARIRVRRSDAEALMREYRPENH